jgi:hypothetical protein
MEQVHGIWCADRKLRQYHGILTIVNKPSKYPCELIIEKIHGERICRFNYREI